jgi:predicted AAA+ superfamily ATPase
VLRRNLASSILDALAASPVVYVQGPRHSGKTTVVRSLVESGTAGRYLTLDDAGVLSAAGEDPDGFVAGLRGPVVLDEVQKVPELFSAIKAEVDRAPRAGRFLLSGSADVRLLPRAYKSLQERMEVIRLWPLSQGEIDETEEGFVDALYQDTLPLPATAAEDETGLLSRVLRGGYPEVVGLHSSEHRRAWFASYVTTVLHHEIRGLARIEGLPSLLRLITRVAARSGSLANFAELSRGTEIPQTTLKRYMTLLETTLLVPPLPAWSGGHARRLVKSSKLLLCDTGLMGHLLELSPERLQRDPSLLGPLLVTFVAMELRKQRSWSRTRARLTHFRTHGGSEVDLLLEDGSGRIVAIDVKASATARPEDLKGLRGLGESLPHRIHRGVLLYMGWEPITFGPRLHALPIGMLWQLGSRPMGGVA